MKDPIVQTWLIPDGYPRVPEHWKVETLNLNKLFGVRFLNPKSKVKRALLIIHGLGEHSGRYQHFPHYLDSVFSDIMAFDLRGHGRTPGIRGHIGSFSEFIKDILSVIEFYHTQLALMGIEELHLFGHSLGGHLVLRTCFENPGLKLKSVAVSAPFLGISAPIPFIKKTAATLLSSIWGSLQLSTEVNAQGISHDLRVVEAYQNDQLIHDKMTSKFFTEMSASFSEIFSKKQVMNYPFLAMVPLDDKLVCPQKTLALFKETECKDKFLKTYPEHYHEIFNETGKEQVFSDYASWISLHS